MTNPRLFRLTKTGARSTGFGFNNEGMQAILHASCTRGAGVPWGSTWGQTRPARRRLDSPA